MRIQPIVSVNFGYNKKLNRELIEKLNTNPTSPINRTLLKVNETCNYCEKRIVEAEQSGLKNNANVINYLLNFFLSAKCFLFYETDRLFPELNYSKRELENYDYESISQEPIDAETAADDDILSAYLWRDYLYPCYQSLNNTAVYSTAKDITISPSQSNEFTEGSKFLEKFKPTKSSPKSLDDVVGIQNITDDVKDLIIFPLVHQEETRQREAEYGIKTPHFIVFNGPPGCGKTMLAQAISVYSGCDMYMMDLSSVGSIYVNGTVLNIKQAFKEIREKAAKSKKPVILFIDELDSLLKRRKDASGGAEEDNKVVNTLLMLLQEVQDENILVIGATNMYDLLDPALLRRIDMDIYIGLPGEKEMKDLLQRYLSGIPKGKTLLKDKKELEETAKMLVGYSPVNFTKIAPKAGFIAYKKGKDISKEDFAEAIKSSNIRKINEQEYLPKEKRKVTTMGFVQ